MGLRAGPLRQAGLRHEYSATQQRGFSSVLAFEFGPVREILTSGGSRAARAFGGAALTMHPARAALAGGAKRGKVEWIDRLFRSRRS